MGADNLNPLDELKSLDAQVDQINDLAGLKPIFYRLEEIAKANAADFEVQLVSGDVKQHLINRGVRLREPQSSAPPPPLPGATGGMPAGGFTNEMAAQLSGPPPMPTQQPPVAGSWGQIPTPQPPEPPPFPAGLQPPRKLMSSGQFSGPPAPQSTGALPTAGQPTTGPSAFGPPTLNVPPIPAGSSSSGPPTLNVPPAPPSFPPQPNAGFPTGEAAQMSGIGAPPAYPPSYPPSYPAETPALPMGQLPTSQMSPAQSPPQMPPPQPPAQGEWKRAVMIGALVAILIGAAGFGILIVRKRRPATGKEISVAVTTTPASASVRINGQPNCTSPCQMSLLPGDYQVTAFLDGYEPAASGITVGSGQPGASLALTLEPLPQTIRILTDLPQGKVTLDDQPPADLQEGQVVLEKVSPGPHTVKVTGPNADATLTIGLADAQLPAINGPITTRNLLAVVVTSMAGRAHVTTSAGPLKLAVNGQPEADAGPGGVDLHAFQPGVDELILGEGNNQHNVKENFGPAPTATVFLKSDQNIGTLIVSTAEDNVRVFLNNKEYPRRTQRGQLRIQTIGPVSVRVAKDGFESLAAQTGEVKKGSELRLEFKMKALPQFSSLQIRGGTAGVEVLMDQKSVGVIGSDGALSVGNVAPGEHNIELRREHFVTRRMNRNFSAGQTVDLAASDVVLAAERVAPPPVEVKKAPPPPPPTPKEAPVVVVKAGTMDDFENPAAWKKDGETWSHRGAAFLAYKLTPRGVFQFTVSLVKGGNVFRGGRIRWALNYTDNKNYALFELDNKNFWAKEVVKGKTTDRAKTQLNLDKVKMFTVQMEVTPQRVVHTILIDGKWFSMDSWTDSGRNFADGKFGFLVQGDDEIAISDFKFMPK